MEQVEEIVHTIVVVVVVVDSFFAAVSVLWHVGHVD